MATSSTAIKNLRELTGAGVVDCKRALEESSGDIKKAAQLIKKWGLDKAAKKKGRETKQGLVHAYVHNNNKIGSMVTVLCETDFVARTDQFQNLVHDIAMQVAATNPQSKDQLMQSDFIKDPSKKIVDLVRENIAALGENIEVADFVVHRV